MSLATLLVVTMLLATTQSKPPQETTHQLLQRLGFDPISKGPVNHHKKRVALETPSKARLNDVYSSETDSHMFVVKLPPHQPYYLHNKPEQLSNEVIAKAPSSLRTNGKPGRVYHWNMPIVNKMPHYKSYVKKTTGDSKIYHLKITSDKERKQLAPKRHFDKKPELPLKYHKNNVKFYESHNKTKEHHVMSIKELAEAGYEHMHQAHNVQHDQQQNDRPAVTKQHRGKEHNKKSNKHNQDNEVFHVKKDIPSKGGRIRGKSDGPSYYAPALPKQNSFFKYFPGNGKPKSFYVIEKSEQPSRYHRLL